MFAASVALASVLSVAQPVKSSEAPWCAVVSWGDDVHWECRFQSIEECRPNVLAGNRGWCNPNPYFSVERLRASHSRRR
jgi:Protein of unknown function (DUF3551)